MVLTRTCKLLTARELYYLDLIPKLKSGAHSVHAPNASSLKDLQQVERHIRATMSLLHAHLQLKEKQLLHSLACFGNGTKKLTSDMMADIQAHVKKLKSGAHSVHAPNASSLKDLQQKLKSGAHSVHAPNASSLKDLQQVERHIRATMSLLHAHLQLKEKQLLHSLACFGNGTKKLTSDMMADIQAHVKSVNMLLQNAQTVIASPTMYCLDVDKLLSRLKSVPDNTPCHIVTSPVSTTAKPKLKIDVDNIKTALNQIDLEIPQNVSPLSLVSTADLPPDYNIPPIAPAMKTSDPKMVLSRPPSSMSVRSDVTNKSDTNSLADNPSTSSAVTIIKDFGSETSAPKSIIPCMPEEVVVVHVDTPGDFYVQRKTAQIDLKKIDCFIDPFYVEKQRPVSRVNLDDIYLAKFAADGKWYRVRVTQIPPPGSPPDAPLTLLYIDWGNGDQQPLCRLRPCPGRIKSIPALAIHCAMYDCVPVHSRAWSPESIKYFVSIILKEDDESSVSMQVYTILPNNNQYCVDLHVLGEYGTVSVRSTLLALNYARQYKSGSSSVSSVDSRHDPVPLTKTNSAESLSVIPEPGLPKHTLVDVRVSYVESPAYFCVQKVGESQVIFTYIRMIGHYLIQLGLAYLISHLCSLSSGPGQSGTTHNVNTYLLCQLTFSSLLLSVCVIIGSAWTFFLDYRISVR
ncbi:uncharacterized protein LOC103518046 [Diaphorina citri]|uniref:Uncharacterized protein LOC103518046 n=1 Tax=Diaphorina citri TaxID=121845 RepID=A0A1S4ELX2_DIACI|nr:uncharacterized protein LOC103518046 [Diaphorina citri]